jgi:hypothetical protein
MLSSSRLKEPLGTVVTACDGEAGFQVPPSVDSTMCTATSVVPAPLNTKNAASPCAVRGEPLTVCVALAHTTGLASMSIA